MSRVILAAETHLFLWIAPEWTREHLIPLFDWDRDALPAAPGLARHDDLGTAACSRDGSSKPLRGAACFASGSVGRRTGALREVQRQGSRFSTRRPSRESVVSGVPGTRQRSRPRPLRLDPERAARNASAGAKGRDLERPAGSVPGSSRHLPASRRRGVHRARELGLEARGATGAARRTTGASAGPRRGRPALFLPASTGRAGRCGPRTLGAAIAGDRQAMRASRALGTLDASGSHREAAPGGRIRSADPPARRDLRRAGGVQSNTLLAPPDESPESDGGSAGRRNRSPLEKGLPPPVVLVPRFRCRTTCTQARHAACSSFGACPSTSSVCPGCRRPGPGPPPLGAAEARGDWSGQARG